MVLQKFPKISEGYGTLASRVTAAACSLGVNKEDLLYVL